MPGGLLGIVQALTLPTGFRESLDVVPFRTPLVARPAAITTILVLLTSAFAPTLVAWIGTSASKAIGKVARLFLAAISVALIRTGVAGISGHMGSPPARE